MLQTVGIFAIAPVGRSAARLHVRGSPGLRADCTDEGCRMKSTGANFHIKRLQNHTALIGPVILQGLDQALEATQIGRWQLAHLIHWSKVRDYN